MPQIKVPQDLPAIKILRNENIDLMTSRCIFTSGRRFLKILLLNLMPKKIETENQFLRLLSNTSFMIDVTLLRIDNHDSHHTPREHLNKFYCNFEDISADNFDGLIITGAPLGLIDFRNVRYWSQIELVINWAKKHVKSTIFVCWAVQAALNILYNIPRQTRKTKLSGVFLHHTLQSHAELTRGFDDKFLAPHSRYAAFPYKLISKISELDFFAISSKAGAYLFASKDKRFVFVTGHPEYDSYTLANEYRRDYKAGLKPRIPANYNTELLPKLSWRSHSYLLFSNWINHYVSY
ncbi:MAG: homoserine O-succinyltransferase [Candidatus Dasytiphilus stammeri]